MMVEDTITDILGSMTVQEKARQLQISSGWDLLEDGQFSPSKARDSFGALGAGVVLWGRDVSPEIANEIQMAAMNASSQAIPALFADECLHGVQGDGHTIFPSPLSFSAGWNPDLARQYGEVMGAEARAGGQAQCWSPVCGLAREPRWGRTEEEMGEDPYLASKLVEATTRGMSTGAGGEGDLTSNNTVSALLKHYAGYSVPAGGHNSGVAHMGRRELRETFLPVFEAAVAGGAQGVMASYNEIDGVPTAGDHWILTEILRDEFGFTGYVSSDFGAISGLCHTHNTAADCDQAIKQYLDAGGSVNGFDFGEDYEQGIVRLSEAGALSDESLDTAVRNVLRVKARLGLLDGALTALTDVTLVALANPANPKHQAVAKQAALEAMTLLENKDGVLPLDASLKSIAVIGPNADEPRFGDYTAGGWAGGSPGGGGNLDNANIVPVLEGIKTNFAGADIRYAVGAGIVERSGDDYFLTIHRHHLTPPDDDNGTGRQQQQQQGLRATYFPSTDLTGVPAMTRVDSEANFHFMNLGPDPVLLPSTSFSVRWEGMVTSDTDLASGGKWGVLFNGIGDVGRHGARLYVDGELVIDCWENATNSGAVYPSGGTAFSHGQAFKIVLEYFQTGYQGGQWPAVALQWSLLSDGDAVAEACAAACAADVAVVVVGGASEPASDGTEGEGVDRALINLPGDQLALVQALWNATQAAGTPMVLVAVQGKPLAEPWIAENVGTIIEAWQSGQAQGAAVGEVLSGRYNPSGKLPMTFMAGSDVLPRFYNVKPSSPYAGSEYCDVGQAVLWPFGHGLSFTQFNYSALSITPLNVTAADETVTVKATVSNVGGVAGQEVAQLYVRDVVASVTTPVKQLKGFKRTASIEAGASLEVSFDIDIARDLRLLNRSYEWAVEPGLFEVFVGGSSDDLPLTGDFTVVR